MLVGRTHRAAGSVSALIGGKPTVGGQGTQELHLAPAGTCRVAGRVRLISGPGERAPGLAAGAFDLVPCHGVAMYIGDITPMLTALAG
jgi:hypothetical protein